MQIKDASALVDAAFADVEADIFYQIKTNPADRATLLSQLDVISKAKERTDARFDQYPTA